MPGYLVIFHHWFFLSWIPIKLLIYSATFFSRWAAFCSIWRGKITWCWSISRSIRSWKIDCRCRRFTWGKIEKNAVNLFLPDCKYADKFLPSDVSYHFIWGLVLLESCLKCLITQPLPEYCGIGPHSGSIDDRCIGILWQPSWSEHHRLDWIYFLCQCWASLNSVVNPDMKI